MVNGTHCPSCNRDIGVWAIFKAGLPNRIHCPHCGERLYYRGIVGVVLVLIVAVPLSFVGAMFAVAAFPSLHPNIQPYVVCGLMLGIWSVIELVTAWFLRSSRELKLWYSTPDS